VILAVSKSARQYLWAERPPHCRSGVRKWGHYEYRSSVYSLVISSYRAKAGSAGGLKRNPSVDHAQVIGRGAAHPGRRSWRRRPGGTGPRDRSSAVSRWGTTPSTTRARRPHHPAYQGTSAPSRAARHPPSRFCMAPWFVERTPEGLIVGSRISRAHPGATLTGRDVTCCRHHSRS
jgi:hypothetical protein